MEENFKKSRYYFGKGCSISYTYGNSAGGSTLSFSHYTTNCMFYYFIKGYGNIKVEGKIYDIKEGDIVLINPSELYRCEIFDTSFHKRFVLRINHSILDNFTDDASALVNPFFEREKGWANLIPAKIIEETGIKKKLYDIFTLATAASPSKNVLALCKTMEVLSLLKNQIVFGDEETRANHGNPMINACLLYINNHFREDISVSSLAHTFNINVSYLSHLFKEYVGISPWNYVICKRLNYFNSLLRKNYSIEEAYIMAGFQNYSNFFRLYKKYMNMTPAEFKRQKYMK